MSGNDWRNDSSIAGDIRDQVDRDIRRKMRHRGEPSLLRAIRGPITLITVGVLFALNNFTQYSFDKTWPVLLIVFGLLSLVKRGMEPAMPPPPPVQPFPPPAYAYPRAGQLRSSAGRLRAEHVCATAAREGRIRRQRAAAGRCRTESTSPTRRHGMRRSFSGPLLLLAIGALVPVAEPASRGSRVRPAGAVLAVRADRVGTAAADRRADLASRRRARQFHGRRGRAGHPDLHRGQRHLAGARARRAIHARRPGFLGPGVRLPGVGDRQCGGHEAHRL